MAASTFGERLSYALFVYHFEHGDVPGHAALGRASGRTGPTVLSWRVREEPPPFHDVRRPLSNYLEVSEGWLFDNVGDPPHPELWRNWLAKHRHRAGRDSGGANQRKRGA